MKTVVALLIAVSVGGSPSFIKLHPNERIARGFYQDKDDDITVTVATQDTKLDLLCGLFDKDEKVALEIDRGSTCFMHVPKMPYTGKYVVVIKNKSPNDAELLLTIYKDDSFHW